jgi:TonB family protein
VTVVVALALPRVALAQTPVLAPPTIAEEAEASYPERARGLSRVVELIVHVGADGTVMSVDLVTPVGDVLDDVAVDAARRHKFNPATRDDRPIPSKIKLRLSLHGPTLTLAPTPRPTPTPTLTPTLTTPTLTLAPAPDVEDVRVKGERPVASPTRRTLDRREIETIPGTFGDAIRAVESLPGAARAPAFSGLIVLRGSAPRDTQVFLDGMSVPLAYHFGGLTAIVPTELLERVDLYPGNFDIAFGRGLGGVVDIGLRSPASDRPHGLVKVDMLDFRGLVETPLGKHTRVLVAARRSWFDAWFPSVAGALGVGATAAPVYHDAELVLEQDLGDRTVLTGSAITSSDSLVLAVPPSASDASFSGDIANKTDFHRAQVRVESKLADGARLSAQSSVGWDRFSISIGKLVNGHSEALRVGTRARAEVPLGRGVRLHAGADVESGNFAFALTFPPIPTADEPDTGPLFGRRALSQTAEVPYLNPAGYVGLEGQWFGRLKALLGVRVEGFTGVSGVALEPRTNIRVTLDPHAARKTTFKAALGVFAQAPQVWEVDPVFGTPGLRITQALHGAVGVEQELARGVTLSIKPFAKRLFDLVSRRVDPTGQSGFRNGNEGTGLAYGVEVLLKLQPTERFMGWLAYTISRSERRALPELPSRLFELDQTHILSVLGSVKLDGGWELGARVRVVSGNPYTPIVGGAFDSDAGAYAAIERQPLFSSRLPPFFSLDLRIEKTFRVGTLGTIRAYLDVVNATNRANVEGIATSFDFSAHGWVTGLPILPNLGLRGEL